MKKYKTIIADPPWQYNNKKKNGEGLNGCAESHYETMNFEELSKLRVKDQSIKEIKTDDSIILLWCTWPFLKDGIGIIENWGFRYITGFPWVKIKGAPTMDLFGNTNLKIATGVGFWFRGATEAVLLGKSKNAKLPNRNPYVGLLGPRFEHSRKPENIYEIAETFGGPYLELFARRKRDGWDSWGNEI